MENSTIITIMQLTFTLPPSLPEKMLKEKKNAYITSSDQWKGQHVTYKSHM